VHAGGRRGWRVGAAVSALPSALRRRSLPALPIAAGIAALCLAALAWLLFGGDGDEAGGRAGAGAASTAAVTRGTLVSRELVEGTLGYAGERTVVNRLGDAATPTSSTGETSASATAGGGSMTVTSLAQAGSVVRRGGTLYRLDSLPIVLMYGSTPAYRDLQLGVSDGRDVRQLEANLAALGFDPGTVDGSFSSSTAGAVSDWQQSQGLSETGAVELGRVVFLPGPRRIGERKVAVGSLVGAGAEVLETSSTRRVVTVELEASLQNIAREGDRVEVTLPSDRSVDGRITDVGRVAREQESSTGTATASAEEEPELVIDVTVKLGSTRGLGRFDQAPVSVGLVQESRRAVLAAPVDALLARRGGGYAVELAAGSRIVPVETGMFADGLVEISGRGIGPGTRVVVPGE
jgi:peptidoglycan hydrolase-like protein with peptidoglycan-binding domain